MTLLPETPVEKACADVEFELYRQEALWGEQNHPDGTGEGYLKGNAIDRKSACDSARTLGTMTWRHILDEEVAEAFAETDTVRLREELIQVAAVALNWVGAIDRRGS